MSDGLPQISQGGIVHGSVPLDQPEGGDVHIHSWYDQNGNLVEEIMTGRVRDGGTIHIPLDPHGGPHPGSMPPGQW